MNILEKIQELISRKLFLIKQQDTKNISTKEFIKEIEPLEVELTDLTKQRLELLDKEIREKYNKLEQEQKIIVPVKIRKKSKYIGGKTMETVEVSQPTEELIATQPIKQKRERKKRENSIVNLIEKVLKMKSIKNINDAVEKIAEIEPTVDKKKVKSYISVVITAVNKNKSKRWSAYKWNKETFTLEEKN